ncbi:MAG: hypothetical protein U9R75_11120 [Candidatus Thermoplasmatota archaeon]|nr:hypothetical protein [Candidatus Thermoplasmatota archaeon]
MVIKDEMVRNKFSDAAVDGKISCSKCMEIARELDLEKSKIASTMTDMNIKIIQCQLGCFQ